MIVSFSPLFTGNIYAVFRHYKTETQAHVTNDNLLKPHEVIKIVVADSNAAYLLPIAQSVHISSVHAFKTYLDNDLACPR